MVEVFRTNVKDPVTADTLIGHIHTSFADYKANFDLEDCDNILRVQCMQGSIKTSLLIDLLKKFGCDVEVLPDELSAAEQSA